MKTVFILLCILQVSTSFFTKMMSRDISLTKRFASRKYPLSRYEREHFLKRLNSKNVTIQTNEIISGDVDEYENLMMQAYQGRNQTRVSGIRIIIDGGGGGINPFTQDDGFDDDDRRRRGGSDDSEKKSENFEVITKSPVNFTNVGGYDNIKKELGQCIDMLKNYKKYAKYNVRIPRGLIFEGPPGNGKTLLAKALAGEAHTGFIAVSGSEFQEKYVGVGSARIRELFKLAKKNVPCIIFIDEIDALGRTRSGDGETSSSERDSTLNELLVALDGFKNNTGIFIIAATNRVDLLDPALMRPGRIDKRMYIGIPDKKAREAILNIHLKGKPYDANSIIMPDIVEITNGLSAAQIENLVNEAMLNALRDERTQFTSEDIDTVMNKMMVGWQPTEHQFSANMIDNIAIHEMGHAIVGMLSKHHSKMTKVIINLSAPRSPAYTIFEASPTSIFTREALFEHLMILLAGRIAEEVFFDISVTTGAINDFEEAAKLAQKMIVYYGMGKEVIYPSNSDKYKEMIDNEIVSLLNDAYGYAEFIIRNSKDLMQEGAELLKRDKLLKADTLLELINTKYKHVLTLKIK